MKRAFWSTNNSKLTEVEELIADGGKVNKKCQGAIIAKKVNVGVGVSIFPP